MSYPGKRVTESEVAFAIIQIAKKRSDSVATFQRCKKEIPDYLELSPDDLTMSRTRPNEPMWHQLIRNIKSHYDQPGNYICEGYLSHLPRVGYRVTDSGRNKKHP